MAKEMEKGKATKTQESLFLLLEVILDPPSVGHLRLLTVDQLPTGSLMSHLSLVPDILRGHLGEDHAHHHNLLHMAVDLTPPVRLVLVNVTDHSVSPDTRDAVQHVKNVENFYPSDQTVKS